MGKMCPNRISNKKTENLLMEKLTILFPRGVCHSAPSHAGWMCSLGFNFWPNLTKRLGFKDQDNKSQTLTISVKLTFYYNIARLPSTRVALVIQKHWIINICHHLKGLVKDYFWLGYRKKTQNKLNI